MTLPLNHSKELSALALGQLRPRVLAQYIATARAEGNAFRLTVARNVMRDMSLQDRAETLRELHNPGLVLSCTV